MTQDTDKKANQEDAHGLPEVMTAQEVAAFCRVSPKTVYKACEQYRLPFTRVGKQLRFYGPDVLDWLRGNASVSR